MADLNKESMAIWKSLKPMIDEEIKAQTRGSVQRRKMKVTTAPSLVTNVIGVTEPYGTEMLIPFNTNLSAANVGDVVWVEFMYGATNAFASMYASADTKDWTVGGNANIIGNATINGVLDVTNRRCSAILSSAGWYRALVIDGAGLRALTNGYRGSIITIKLMTSRGTNNRTEEHEIKLFAGSNDYPFINEVSVSTTQWIDKIRYTFGEGSDYTAVDIHFIGTLATNVTACFTVDVDPTGQQYITAESLQSVADAPAGETVLITHEFAAVSKTPVQYGTANGWDYVVYADKTIEATRTISQTLSYYTTVGGFYGYYISGIALPFTMANTRYYVGATWQIGNGFSIQAGLLSVTTTEFNAYALATAHGTTESVSVDLLLKGKIA